MMLPRSRVRRIGSAIYTIIAALLTAFMLLINVRLYVPSSADYQFERRGPDVLAQLHFVGTAARAGAGKDMQSLFPEGFFFIHALYGLAWVEVGMREPAGSELHLQAQQEARWALSRLDSTIGRAPFSAALNPPFGVFYTGWSAWLRGGLLSLQAAAKRDPAEVARFVADCTALAAAFDRSPSPFLPAYPRQAWPVDSVVGIAALRLHDNLLPPQFTATIDRWLQAAKTRLDPATGLLPHRVDPTTGQGLEGARGSSQSIIARFLVEIDPAWGHDQYIRFRRQFVTTVAGLPGVREYPHGVTNTGDVDSGPLVAGDSFSASTVTLGAAFVHGDRALADPLLHTGEALGLPISWGGAKRYAFGMLPVGDAFLVWSKTARPWIAPVAGATLPDVVAWWWRFPFHGLTLALFLLLWWRRLRTVWRRVAQP